MFDNEAASQLEGEPLAYLGKERYESVRAAGALPQRRKCVMAKHPAKAAASMVGRGGPNTADPELQRKLQELTACLDEWNVIDAAVGATGSRDQRPVGSFERRHGQHMSIPQPQWRGRAASSLPSSRNLLAAGSSTLGEAKHAIAARSTVGAAEARAANAAREKSLVDAGDRVSIKQREAEERQARLRTLAKQAQAGATARKPLGKSAGRKDLRAHTDTAHPVDVQTQAASKPVDGPSDFGSQVEASTTLGELESQTPFASFTSPFQR